MGFEYSTRGAITVSIEDIVVPPEKDELAADAHVDKIGQYRRGPEDDTQTLSRYGPRPTTYQVLMSMGMLNPINR